MPFPGRLREARNRRHLTQAQLAQRLSVNEATVRGWEAGRSMPRTKHLHALAEALGVEVDWLLDAQPERRIDASAVTGLVFLGAIAAALTIAGLVRGDWALLAFCGVAWIAVLGQLSIEVGSRRRNRRR